jgi:hypothetical protein
MTIKRIFLSLIIACGILATSSASAVSDWALQRARERLAQAKAEEEAAVLMALAKQIEHEEWERFVAMWTAVGYCTVAVGKGVWFVAKNAIKSAAFATKATVKTAYNAVADPDELRDQIKNKEIEPFVGIACLSGILVATIAQIVDAATH